VAPWLKTEGRKGAELDNDRSGFDVSKSFFFHYQICFLLINPASLQALNEKTRQVITTFTGFSFLQMHSGGICPFPGLTTVSTAAFESMMPMLVLICIFGIEAIRRMKRMTSSNQDLYGAIVRLILIGFAQYAKVGLMLLRCVAVGASQETYLFVDATVQCWEHAWQMAVLVWVVCCVLPCPLIVGLGAMRIPKKSSPGSLSPALCCIPPPPSSKPA